MIKNLKHYLKYNNSIKIIQSLDKFHFKQTLWRILPNKSVCKVLSKYIISNNKKYFNSSIKEIIDIYPHGKEKIKEYYKHINNNWNNILNLYKSNLSCPMESQISYTFASCFTSRSKAYSTNDINKLINLRLLNKNKYNIKQLLINNFNKQNIINLNKPILNFSMFNKNYLLFIVFR